jgi:hypothetical protein
MKSFVTHGWSTHRNNLLRCLFQGWMELTYLYIGYYYEQIYSESDSVYYRMSVAYLVSTAGYFLFILVLIVRQ